MEQSFNPQGQDLNNDGLVDEIDAWLRDQKTPKEDRERQWILDNLTPKGLSADLATREIIAPDGRVVGKLPDF